MIAENIYFEPHYTYNQVNRFNYIVTVGKKCICFFPGDEISGISVSIRERDDIVTIWNTRSDLAEQSNMLVKVKELVPEVTFTASFYKGRLYLLDCFKVFFV